MDADNELEFIPFAPPAEQGSLLGASGGAAPLISANAPNTENRGVPTLTRSGMLRWAGRVERIQGAP